MVLGNKLNNFIVLISVQWHNNRNLNNKIFLPVGSSLLFFKNQLNVMSFSSNGAFKYWYIFFQTYRLNHFLETDTDITAKCVIRFMYNWAIQNSKSLLVEDYMTISWIHFYITSCLNFSVCNFHDIATTIL